MKRTLYDFGERLETCCPELISAFRELRELFYPHGEYRPAPTTAEGQVLAA